MKSPSELKRIADSLNARTRVQNEKVLNRSIKRNIQYLERGIERAANEGRYSAQSDNLCDPVYRAGSSFSQDKMMDLLRDALIQHFEPLGFRWEGKGCNYFTVIWS